MNDAQLPADPCSSARVALLGLGGLVAGAVLLGGLGAMVVGPAPVLRDRLNDMTVSHWISRDLSGMERSLEAYLHLLPRDPEARRLKGMHHYYRAAAAPVAEVAKAEKLAAAAAFLWGLSLDPLAIELTFNLGVVGRDLAVSHGLVSWRTLSLEALRSVVRHPGTRRGDLRARANALLASMGESTMSTPVDSTLVACEALEKSPAGVDSREAGDIPRELGGFEDDPRVWALVGARARRAGQIPAARRAYARAWAHSGHPAHEAEFHRLAGTAPAFPAP